jgi:hypothetical protein
MKIIICEKITEITKNIMGAPFGMNNAFVNIGCNVATCL